MKRDGRTLDHATLETIRMMAVERVREGEAPAAVIASYGFSRTSIYKWLAAGTRPMRVASRKRITSLCRQSERIASRSSGFRYRDFEPFQRNVGGVNCHNRRNERADQPSSGRGADQPSTAWVHPQD